MLALFPASIALVAGLEAARVPHTAYFFDAGHSAKSNGMSKMLRQCVDEYVAGGPMRGGGGEPAG